MRLITAVIKHIKQAGSFHTEYAVRRVALEYDIRCERTFRRAECILDFERLRRESKLTNLIDLRKYRITEKHRLRH